jgi:hypothetical protein
MPDPGPCQIRGKDPLLAVKLELVELGKRLAWYLIAEDRKPTQGEVIDTLNGLSAHSFNGATIGSIRDQTDGRFVRCLIAAAKSELEFINALEIPT